MGRKPGVTRKILCPHCGQLRQVRGDGCFAKHNRTVQLGVSLVAQLCPGSGQDAGLW